MSSIREKSHTAWYDMKRRCKCPHLRNYYRYGGRGISYDPTWESYNVFISEMGSPKKGECLDRIDNNKGYSKENCRWASGSINSYNKTSSRRTDLTKALPRGVHLSQNKKKYVAYIGIDSHSYNIGTFETVEDAEQAYWKISIEWYGSRVEIYE